jgi:Nif-specific regulatory protein
MTKTDLDQQKTRSPVTELLEGQLFALLRISQILGGNDEIMDMLEKVLFVLEQEAGLFKGLISLTQEKQHALQICAINHDSKALENIFAHVRYKEGEGVLGSIYATGRKVILEKISDHPQFLDRLSIYDLSLPFIAVPIKDANSQVIGVLAAQPETGDKDFLMDQSQFMTTVGNMLAQTVRLMINILKGDEIADERDELRRKVRSEYGFDDMMIGYTPVMRRVFDQIRRVAKWDTTVLILGESGTGKELIANAIHYNSQRSHQPMVKLNCASLPETLLESELFGHEKGSFTGAIKTRKGRFEQAHNGTLFLDEIGEISPMFQAKLLRVLQEGELERVGGDQTIKVNVRIVAATNRDLESEVEKGNFREDLYYRLNVMSINVPPLRDRLEDIPELSHFLLEKISKHQARKLKLTDSAIRTLSSHNWPGNVRELENCLERSAIMSETGLIDRDMVILHPLHETAKNQSILPMAASTHYQPADSDDENLDEREKVIAALERAGWVQAKAARLLNMTPRQIAYRIQILNIPMRKM